MLKFNFAEFIVKDKIKLALAAVSTVPTGQEVE
jgi:hypothetical protein